MQKKTLALIYDIANPPEKLLYAYTMFAAAPLYYYRDLRPGDVKFFENSTPAALRLLAEKIKKDYGDYESVDINAIENAVESLISALWLQSSGSSGNAIFEAIKERIQKDEKTAISFICSANFNRSAVAELVFRHMLQKNGNKNVTVLSAGAYYEEREETQTALQEKHSKDLISKYGVDRSLIDSFKSKQFTAEHAAADFVIAAEDKHKEYVLQNFPRLAGKVFLLSEIIPDVLQSESILSVEFDPSKNFENEADLAERTFKFASYFFDGSASGAAGSGKYSAVYLDEMNDIELINALNNNEIIAIYPKREVLPEDSDGPGMYDLGLIRSSFEMYSKIISDYLFERFGTATEYFLNEMLKNAFVHGNRGDLSSPVFIDVSGDTITVYNAVKDGGDSESAERQTLFEISALAGNQAGVINMKGTVSPYGVNAADNFKLLSYSADTVEINGQPYYRASVTAANEENLKQILEKTAEDAKNMFGTVSAIQDALDEKTKELSKKYIKSAAFMESVKDSIIRTETANAAAGTDGFENALSRELYGEIVKLNLSVLFETSKTDKEKEEFIEKAADLIIPSLRNGRVISLVIDKNDADGKYTFDELSGKFKYTDKILASISKKIIPEFFERRYWEDAVPAYYEMLKNAVVHGNSAFLDRPVYIKFDADGREIKVINTEQEPDSSRMEAASYDNGGLFGMREGTNVISGAGIYKLRQQKPLSGSDIKISEASLTPKFPFISRDKGAAADLSAPLKNISGFLSRAKKLTLEDSADILLLCGNATVETFKEVLESHKKYKSADKGLKILISGGFGRLTLDVLREAVKLGIEVPVSAGETIKTEEEYNGLINAIKNDKGEIDDAKRRERVKISESKIIEMILNYLAKQDNIDISGLDIILDESARHTGENFTNPALLELIKSLNKPKVRLAYIQTPLQQLRTEMTFNGAFKDMAINNEIEGISTTVDIDYGSFGSAGELLYLTAGELLRIVIYSLAGNTIPEINGSGYMFDRIPLSAWTDIAALIERSDNSAAIKKRLKEEIVLRLIRDGKTVFPSEESLINALKPNASQEQLKAMEPFIGAVYSDMPLTADSTVYYYKNTVSGRLAVWFMRNFNKEAKAGNYSDDQIIQILLAPKKEAKLIAAIAAGAMTAEGFLSMHTKYRESSEQGKETYRTALDVIVKASKAAYEEAVSLTGNPDYAARAAAEASVAPHKMWNAKRSEMSLVSDENDSQVRRSKLRIAVGVLAMITVISFFTIFHIQIKKAEEELARLGAELEAKQAEQEELYFLTDMKMFNVLFDRQILSGYFHMPEDDEAFEKAKQDSIAATLNEENIALIKEVYERLAEAGITFDRKYTVYLIEGGEARGAFALPELEVMFLSADIIDFENFTKDEIMANLAEIIAHELDHIKRAAADPSLSDLELEYYAWKAAAEARKAIFGEQDQAAKEDEDISKAFGIIVEQMDTVEGFMDGKSKEDGIKYMREDANLYYLSIGVDRSGNNIIQIILYDRNLEKPDYLLVCNVNVEAGKFQGMMFVSYAEYLDINSILPENLDMVNKMAHKGRGAVLISAAVAFKEFAKSVLHPAKFVDMHPTQAGKTGAKILIAATYAFAAAVSVTALFIPAAAIAFLPLGILAGVFSNIVTHIIIDYHYIKASGLIGAVREFGSAATLTQEGYINLPVYVINERPENYGELGLKNTGVKLEGNTLWAGNFAGAAVVYADGVNQQAIARELASNRKINNIIKENAGKAAKKTLKNISVSFIEVDHTAAKESVDYSENGNIRVSADMVKEAAQRGNSADYSASLRRVQNIDASAFAKSVIHYLDDIKTLKEFEEYLSQHKEIGNGRIMINESLFNDIGSGIFSKFLAEAAKDGVQVYVLRSGISGTAALAAAGFAGYVSSGDGALYDFALDSSVKVKTGVFYDIPSLEEDMRNSGGIYVIENTLLKNALDSERNAMGIRDLVEILTSVKILKVFRLRPVTEESALNAARNFEIKDIPGLDGQNIEALKALISARDFSAQDFKAALGIKENAADPVSVYLMKLKTGTDNNAAIAKSFMLGIIEKALTADILRKYGKEYGLKDIGHETILGRALFAKVKYAIGDTAPDITPDSFKTVKEAEEKLNGALAELMPKAFDDKDAKSVNAIIELIPAIGEERRKLVVTDDIKPAMNIRNYGSILSAA
ncbi:MAG: hypothetical protein LBR69_07010 [Endomicrobium sp.]|jgi:protein-tyrosine-phosphatase/anti-sigma regulatory factor (Ser/Thr protein kinase)|nr:hypothetical protein [Endomicrobium sp.]